jgi:uncharacterized protein YjbI with pentapeptide repeats
MLQARARASMTAFSLSSLTISGTALSALQGITNSLAQSNQATSFATASVIRAQPVVSVATTQLVQKIQTELQQSQAQQQALAQASGVVNAAIKGATQVAGALTQLRGITSTATQAGTTSDQLQSLSQQFNSALSGISQAIQSSAFNGVNLLNGSNVQQFQAPGLTGNALQSLNLQTGVVNQLNANSLQNAISGGGGNPFGDLISKIENAVSTNVGDASSATIASFTNQFITQAGGTSNQSQVEKLGNQLISALGGQTTFDHQTQRSVGQILDSITFNAPQSVTTGLINQLVTSLQNSLTQPPPATNLQGSDFAGANLQGANFAGANLAGVDFTGANLQGVNFAGANLTGANLEGANLQGANLQGATIQNAYFGGANLQGTIYQNNPPPRTQEPFIPEPPPPFGQNFERQNLQGGNFTGQNLQSADFERSRLQNADFGNANLTGASFEGSNAQGANFVGANLVQVDFAGANLQGANFSAPPSDGGGSGGDGGGGSGGSGPPNFDSVLSAINGAISTVANSLSVLNQEAQAIKDQNKSSSDLATTLNKEIGGLVNTNLTTETAKTSALQIAVNLGLQTISITGQRGQALVHTLLTGEASSSKLPTEPQPGSQPVSSSQTQAPKTPAGGNNTTSGGSGSTGSFSPTSSSRTSLVPPVSIIPPAVITSTLNIQA